MIDWGAYQPCGMPCYAHVDSLAFVSVTELIMLTIRDTCSRLGNRQTRNLCHFCQSACAEIQSDRSEETLWSNSFAKGLEHENKILCSTKSAVLGSFHEMMNLNFLDIRESQRCNKVRVQGLLAYVYNSHPINSWKAEPKIVFLTPLHLAKKMLLNLYKDPNPWKLRFLSLKLVMITSLLCQVQSSVLSHQRFALPSSASCLWLILSASLHQ